MITTAETNKKNSGAEQQLYEQVATVDAAGDGEKDLEADTVNATETESLVLQSVTNVRATVVREPPPSYTCLSCFVFIFCCWPIGLYAIVMSSTVQTRLENNDFEGAYRASEAARMAASAGIVIGFFINCMAIVMNMPH